MSDVDEIKKAVVELKLMQIALDDPVKEMDLAVFRNILGHVLFSMIELIEGNLLLREKIDKLVFGNKIPQKTVETLYS